MIFAPYHAVVRANLRGAFKMISSGRHGQVVAQFADDAVFRFSGEHALGGLLKGRRPIGNWFERLHRLFPDLRLRPTQVIVNGGPWNTRVATRFSVTATLPGGLPYENEGMQYVRIVWGRIVEDCLYEDTDRLKAALRRIAESGAEEAQAPPLSTAT
jgi:ketosteroid isomerase-like protein